MGETALPMPSVAPLPMPSILFSLPRSLVCLGAATIAIAGFASHARADKILNPTAVFAGLDKITGRIIAFEVAMDETVQFGSLQITPRVCVSRPAKEAPLTDGFVEVDEIADKNQFKRIFSGWMFTASPGLHGVEHPVYDVWLTDCKGGTDIIATPPQTADVDPPPNADVLSNTGQGPKAKETRRRADQPPGAPGAPGTPPGVPPSLQTLQTRPSQDPTASAPIVQDVAPRRAPTQSFFPTSRQSTAVPVPVDPAGR